jgi:hypothetical protein
MEEILNLVVFGMPLGSSNRWSCDWLLTNQLTNHPSSNQLCYLLSISSLNKGDLSWCQEYMDHSKILERINDNAYKVDLLGKCSVSAIFNIFLSLFIWCRWWFIDEYVLGEREWYNQDYTKKIHCKFQLSQLQD